MSNSKLIEKKDNDLISAFADDELIYWALKWGVTKETIKAAIKATNSNSVSQVYTYLENANKLRLS
ncbi:MAG: DUF3606 domain-containing protein [Pyrinomonadaceae bacterium]|nr:DUF3606 domain-containing protein [Sphingobacteriaceae bacterium]